MEQDFQMLPEPFSLVPLKNTVTIIDLKEYTGNTKGGSITVPLTSCLTGLD
jgi:hypothetical protein